MALSNINIFSRLLNGRLIILTVFCFVLTGVQKVAAHAMPNSVVLLDIKSDRVNAELQLPLNEMESAFGYQINHQSDHLVERLGKQLKAYLLQHIHAVSPDGFPWQIEITDMNLQPVVQSANGPYKELTVHLWLKPSSGERTHQFTLHYDAIIHQVVSHFALVSVRQDWDNGLSSNYPYQVGVIRLDVRSNQILPLVVNIEDGNLWRGFTNMVNLGIDHIREGTDHLLFLIALLLPAPLLVANKQWKGFGGIKYSLIRIIKIVSSFTIGHSITLLIGALGIFHFPGRSVEVLIAVSILISAIHALKPIFPGKEMYIAAGFGLIHGMAFADTLVNLNLDGLRMTLSILGFNLGIELMQLFVIMLIIPWLIILSRNNRYTGLRIVGGTFAAMASIAWILERLSGESNYITIFIQQASGEAKWLILALAIAAISSYFVNKKSIVLMD